MVNQTSKSYLAKPGELKRNYYLVDAKDKILGRVASKVAHILRGKHKATFSPHTDCGDFVVIINAEKVRVTGRKLQEKFYQRYSGYPSGKKIVYLGDMLKHRPTQAIKLAVHGMIQRGPLGNKIRTKLRVYAGDKHPHQAQKLIPFSV